MAGKLRLDMDFIDVAKYQDVLLEFKKTLFLEANIVWSDAVAEFAKTASDQVFIDTAMSAFSLIAPLDIVDPAKADIEKRKVLAQRKRFKAKPLRLLDGTTVKDAYRKATTAFGEAKRSSKVLELSFSNSELVFEYKIVVWQIESVMKGAPVEEGFKAFQQAVEKGFGSSFESKIKVTRFLDPFKKKTIIKAKAR